MHPNQFVYPHTLESHCLTALPAALHTLQTAHSQRLHLLASLAESKERARKATLNRLAPGWGEGGGIMEPVRRESVLIGSAGPSAGGVAVAPKGGAVDLLEEEDEGDGMGLGLAIAQRVEEKAEGKSGEQMGTLLGEDQLGSPKEMGSGTLDRLEQEQMQALVDGLAAMDGERTRKAGLLF